MYLLCGLPFQYLAYFAAIYTLIGYGLMSLVSLYEIYLNSGKYSN